MAGVVTIKKVSLCALCHRSVTETTNGGFVKHPTRGVVKCGGNTPVKGGKSKYRFTVEVGINPETGKRIQLTVTKDTLVEASAELSRIQHEQNVGVYIAPSAITVGEWIDQWLAMKAKDLEVTTMHNYETTLKPAKKVLGHIRLQDLTEEQVEDWVAWLLTSGRVRWSKAGTGLRPPTVDMALARLKDVLNRAVTRKLVTMNVAQYVTVPRRARKADRKTHVEVPPWNETEVHTFVQGMRTDRLYAPLLLSLMGLRPAEVCGLRWKDIDLEAGTLMIANTRTMMGNKTVIEKDTKSMAGERDLPLPVPVWDALRKFKAVQAAEKLACGPAYDDSGYMCANELGVVHTIKQVRTRAYKLMALIGLRRVRLYDARASCFTYLANKGVPDHILARWAGHTNIATTKRWYVKPGVEDLRGAAATWDGLHSAPTALREIP